MIYAKWGKDRAAERALIDAAFRTGETRDRLGVAFAL